MGILQRHFAPVTFPHNQPAFTCTNSMCHLDCLPCFPKGPSLSLSLLPSSTFRVHVQKAGPSVGSSPLYSAHCSWLVGEKWMAFLGISPGISADKQMKLSKGKAINIVWNKISVFSLVCFQLSWKYLGYFKKRISKMSFSKLSLEFQSWSLTRACFLLEWAEAVIITLSSCDLGFQDMFNHQISVVHPHSCFPAKLS